MSDQPLTHVQLCDPKTVAQQAALSMEFSRQECWSGLPFPSPGNIPDPGLNPHLLCLLHWQVDSLPLLLLGSPVYKYTHTHTVYTTQYNVVVV